MTESIKTIMATKAQKLFCKPQMAYQKCSNKHTSPAGRLIAHKVATTLSDRHLVLFCHGARRVHGALLMLGMLANEVASRQAKLGQVAWGCHFAFARLMTFIRSV